MKINPLLKIAYVFILLILIGFLLYFSNKSNQLNPNSAHNQNTASTIAPIASSTQDETPIQELPWTATYIHAVDWPPQIQTINQPYSCTEAGLETGRAGQTVKKNINGREYCVTRESEGAAGSTYTNYAYAYSKEDKTVILTFSTRAVQCGNYDEPEKTKCEKERVAFDIDRVVDKRVRAQESK